MKNPSVRLLRLLLALPLATSCALPLLMKEIEASLSENGEPSIVIDSVEPHDLFPGDVVTVKGKGFSAPLGVEFENVGPCVVKDEDVSDTQFTCTTLEVVPDEAYEKQVALVVQSVAGDVRKEEAAVFHKREVHVDTVTPGDVQPGDVLTITGSGFAKPLVAALDVGDCVVVDDQSFSATQFSCKTPGDIASDKLEKPVGLTVTVGTASSRKEGAVTFRPPDIVVAAVNPAEARPGDVLTVTGSGFASSLVAQFQGIGPCLVDAASVTSTQFRCQAHGNLAAYTFDAPVGLVVSIGSRSGSNAGVVTFRRPTLSVTKVEPETAGAFDLVTVTGTGLTKDVTIKLDGTTADAFSAAADGVSATFRVPNITATGPLGLDVTRVDAAQAMSTLALEARDTVSGSDLATSGDDLFSSSELGLFGAPGARSVQGWVRVDHAGTVLFAELEEVVDTNQFKTKAGAGVPALSGAPFVVVWKP